MLVSHRRYSNISLFAHTYTYYVPFKSQKSTCMSHNTVNMADTKSSRGLVAMGVRIIDCARHDMKLPNGVSNLQKGERCVFLIISQASWS
jgi:hypothetical protein